MLTSSNIPIQARGVSANLSYKITKVVCALRLAKRCVREYVHMTVTSICLVFARWSHKHEFEKDFESRTRQVYFIYPFPRRLKLGKSLQTRCVSIFVRVSWHFKRAKSAFENNNLCKTWKANRVFYVGFDSLWNFQLEYFTTYFLRRRKSGNWPLTRGLPLTIH